MEISALRIALKERKSSIDGEKMISNKKCEIIQERYIDLKERFNANHEKMKNLDDKLKCSTSSRATPIYVNSNPSSNRNFEIGQLNK